MYMEETTEVPVFVRRATVQHVPSENDHVAELKMHFFNRAEHVGNPQAAASWSEAAQH